MPEVKNSDISIEERNEKVHQLYVKYKGWMMGVAMNLLKNRYDAEDAVHNAFVRILEHHEKVGDVDSVSTKAFLSIITKNICIDMIRSINPNVISLEELGEDYPDPRTVESEFFERETARIGLEQFDKLEDIYRDPIILRRLNHLSIAEIAEVLGISYSACAKRIERGEALLLQRSREEGADI